MGSPTPSRRVPVPPLEPEIEAVEVLRASLNRLMNEDFSDIEDPIQLRQKYKDIKNVYKECANRSRAVCSRLQGNGRIADGEEMRGQCLADQANYEMTKKSISALLKDQGCQSVASSTIASVHKWLESHNAEEMEDPEVTKGAVGGSMLQREVASTTQTVCNTSYSQGTSIAANISTVPPLSSSQSVSSDLNAPNANTQAAPSLIYSGRPLTNPPLSAPGPYANIPQSSGVSFNANIQATPLTYSGQHMTNPPPSAYGSYVNVPQTSGVAYNANTPVTSSLIYSGQTSMSALQPSHGSYASIPRQSGVASNANAQAVPPQIYSGQTYTNPIQFLPPATNQGTGSILDVVSKHLLQQDMMKDAIPTFSGNSIYFWSWVTNISTYAMEMTLTPLQTLRLMISHTANRANEYLNNKLLALGNPSKQDMDNIWTELIQRHGSSHQIAAQLKAKIKEFPCIKNQNDGEALLRLYDLCEAIEANMRRCPELYDMNLSTGLSHIRIKLPSHLQGKWAQIGQAYEDSHFCHPPFSHFKNFLRNQARQRSNYHFEIIYDNGSKANPESNPKRSGTQSKSSPDTRSKRSVRPLKTDVETHDGRPSSEVVFCPYHNTNKHTLTECSDFRKLGFNDRRDLLYSYWLCRRCLSYHPGNNACQAVVKCDICNLSGHLAAMHIDKSHEQALKEKKNQQPESKNARNFANPNKGSTSKEPKCTHVCGKSGGKSCSKTLLVDITMDGDNRRMRGYAIVDDHSPNTLIDESVVEYFNKDFPSQEYTMRAASQHLTLDTVGKIVSGLSVRGVFKNEHIRVPESVSCKDIADTRHEVATPATAKSLKHAAAYAQYFPEFDADAPMVMLIGRDCPRAMYDQKLSETFPYVVDSPLGFAIVGQTCVNSEGGPITTVQAKKTSVQFNTSVNSIDINFSFIKPLTRIPDVFKEQPDDEDIGLSQYDKEFLSIVTNGVRVDEDGNLEVPLPLKDNYDLPRSAAHVFKRTENTLNKLKRDPDKLECCVQNIQRSLDCKYIEQVPISEIESDNVNTMPIHIVTHPKKGKHRVVVDPNCNFNGHGINDILLQGPNLIKEMNSVFLKFRESSVAFSADIQDMFHNFKVPRHQRDLLRFYWFESNNPKHGIVPYRYRSHPFGLSSSPGIANFALQLCAMRPMTQEFKSAQEYILNCFYVDDGLSSADTIEHGIQILSNAMTMLKQYNIRLHKVMSNKEELLNAFPESERSADSSRPLTDTSCQRVLGTTWNTIEDRLSLNVDIPLRPFTKRGILSCIGSIYDKNGIVSPVTLAGRLFQRQVMPPKISKSELQHYGWDDELPQEYFASYNKWLESLNDLNKVSIPRCIGPTDFYPIRRELHIFCDASCDCIGYVSYLRSIGDEGQVYVAFINACSKVAPRSATSVPRLELNAAVEAAANASFLLKEFTKQPDALYMYTDSLILMGYLSNKEKRFAKYVERRVSLILSRTDVSTWHYVNTNLNPADIATRPHTPNELLLTSWFSGPEALSDFDYHPIQVDLREHVSELPEEKPNCTILKTAMGTEVTLINELCRRISRYATVVNVLKAVNCLAHVNDTRKQRAGVSLAPRPLATLEQALTLVLKRVQGDSYGAIIKLLCQNKPLPLDHPLTQLSPFLDDQGLVRVGGRLRNANILFNEKHPVILPNDHPFTELLIVHHHGEARHPGGHLTHSFLRQSGYYIQKGKSLIRRIVKECVTCKKLRGGLMSQFMADLPGDRLEETAPFTNVGLDVFGHFNVNEGRNTRRHSSLKKVWVLIIVCLPSRSVHLEPLSAMDTSSFINALTRFISVRGPCKIIRSDQGSNFLGAISQMEGVDIGTLDKQLKIRNIKWILNPPHASHMGGSWERKIGSVRRVLEATFKVLGPRALSYDEFTTVISEAAWIVNQTPLWDVSDDPNDPMPLSPAMLLTLRTGNDVFKEEFEHKDLLRYGKVRYKRVQYLADQFWVRWRKEYIQTLTERHKWKLKEDSVKIDDVVLVRDKHAARNDWPVGRVSEVNHSADGLVRSVTVQLPRSGSRQAPRFLMRPISDLVLLVPSGKPRE